MVNSKKSLQNNYQWGTLRKNKNYLVALNYYLIMKLLYGLVLKKVKIIIGENLMEFKAMILIILIP